jgi:hypothetical protein
MLLKWRYYDESQAQLKIKITGEQDKTKNGMNFLKNQIYPQL